MLAFLLRNTTEHISWLIKLENIHLTPNLKCTLHSPTAPTPSTGKNNLLISVEQIWVCLSMFLGKHVKAAAGDTSPRSCHSSVRTTGVKRDEEKNQSGNCPPFHQTLSHTQTQCTHRLTMTISQLPVYTPAVSASDYRPGTVYLTGAQASTEQLPTSENRLFCDREVSILEEEETVYVPFPPCGQVNELHRFENSVRQISNKLFNLFENSVS